MILVNSVPNPKKVAPKLQKLSHRKVSINVARQTTNEQRHQSGKTYSLVEMKFRRDKNDYLGVKWANSGIKGPKLGRKVPNLELKGLKLGLKWAIPGLKGPKSGLKWGNLALK